jgi:hypothetical protein
MLMMVLGLNYFSGCSLQDKNIGAPIILKPRLKKPIDTTPSPISFQDVTREAEISFKHNNGALGLKLMPETLGSGVVFFDYNADGFQDLFLLTAAIGLRRRSTITKTTLAAQMKRNTHFGCPHRRAANAQQAYYGAIIVTGLLKM